MNEWSFISVLCMLSCNVFTAFLSYPRITHRYGGASTTTVHQNDRTDYSRSLSGITNHISCNFPGRNSKISMAMSQPDPYTAIMIVPTGIGASIGGYAGDALPSARYALIC